MMIESTNSRWRYWKSFWELSRRLLVLLFIGGISSMTIALAQNTRTIEGVVIDQDKNPVGDANVVVMGSSITVSTDANGAFTLRQVPDDARTIIVSKIGFNRAEVTIGNQEHLRITMNSHTIDIEETVVVGYGRQKKETVVGAVSQTTGEVLQRTGGVSNVASALTGTLPGIITRQTSGMPGEENPQIFLRGQSSWNNSTPLILVDGVERPDFFNQMDIASVESISVLKDASATAVYGSRGANGVIIITTKRGASGRAEVSGQFSSAIKTASKLPNKYDSYDAIGVRNLAIERELSAFPEEWSNYISENMRLKYRYPTNLEEAERYPNIDWEKAIFDDFATAYNANINVRGGTPFVKYFANLDYQNEGDLMKKYHNSRGYNPGFDFNRLNVRSNLDFQLTPSTVFKVDLGGTYGVRKSPFTDQGGQSSSFWISAFRNAPDAYMPIYSDGFFGYPGGSAAGINSVRVLSVGGVMYRTTATITSNFALEQNLDKWVKGLSFKGNIAWDNQFREVDRGINDGQNAMQKYINPWDGQVIYERERDPTSQFDSFDIVDWSTGAGFVHGAARRINYQAQLNYVNTFANDHNVSATGVFARQEYAVGSEIPQYREDWVFRTTYNYKSRYMLEYNGAYNGSEQFAPDNRFAFFSSGGLGWMVSNEPFMQNVSFVDNFKLRASYGEVGDDRVGPRFLFLDQWAYGSVSSNDPGTAWMGVVGEAGEQSPYTWYRQTAIGNPNAKWETAYKYNYGADFSFFNNLISGSFDLFRENRKDVLMTSGRSVPTYYGANAPAANLGRTESKGFELDLKFSKSINSKLRIWADFAMTRAINNVIARDDRELEEEYRKNAGYPIGQVRTHISHSYYNTWDELYGSTAHETDNTSAGRIPGGYILLDFNGDGVIDAFDSAPYAYSNIPQNTFNTNFGVDYKGLSLFVQFYGVNNVTRDVGVLSLRNRTNVVYDEGEYWSKETPDAATPLPRWTTAGLGGFINGTRYQFDASYLRLKNAELAYRFQPGQLQRLGISNMRVFLNGNNLLLWTKMPDDREANFGTGQGGSDGAYPTMRRYNLGINLTF